MKNFADQGGQRPRWITPSDICRILPYPTKAKFNIIALLFIQNISSFLKEVSPFRSLFFRYYYSDIPKIVIYVSIIEFYKGVAQLGADRSLRILYVRVAFVWKRLVSRVLISISSYSTHLQT